MLSSARPRGRILFFLSQTNLNRIFRAAIVAAALVCAATAQAAVVRGVVTDRLGAAVRGARVTLVQNGKVVGSASTGYDGGFEVTTGLAGRFVVTAVGGEFALSVSDEFYDSQLGVVERNLVLKPAGVTESVTVTATGIALPQAEQSRVTDVLTSADVATRTNWVDTLRLMPGVSVVETGQYGGKTSLFVRGGASTGNKVLMDGVPATDIGGDFDYGTLGTTAVETLEATRGPGSALYGADAEAGTLQFVTPRGVTPRPELDYTGDGGNLSTYRNEVTASGARQKLDYLGAFSRLDTANAVALEPYHLTTWAGNFGYGTGASEARGTVRYGLASQGVPGSYDFTGFSTNEKQGDQDLYTSFTLEHTTTEGWHNLVRYGGVRRREQLTTFAAVGIPIQVTQYGYTSTNYYGSAQLIRGANGYTAAGQALIAYGGSTYPNRSDSANELDELSYQTDYHFSPHHAVYGSFRFDDEQGMYRFPLYAVVDNVQRTNKEFALVYDGDFHERVYATVGGGVVKDEIFGLKFTPQIGLAWYPVRPGAGRLRGTKVRFNFARGVQEVDLYAQLESLKALLNEYGDAADAAKTPPIGAQSSRSYEGGLDQSLLGQRLTARLTYFHNEFGGQEEFVGAGVLQQNFSLPSAAVTALDQYYGGAYVNTLAYRAMGAEASVDWKPTDALTLRVGYTYDDGVTQKSYSSSALHPIVNYGVPIGASLPLVGARPFRRPAHTGYFAAEYAGKQWTAAVTGAWATRSDDSTFLGGDDLSGGNSLLLPNRNLDYGWTKVDASLAYQWGPRMQLFTQMENLLDNQRIGPIGYPGLPFTVRAGVKARLGGI